MKQLKLIFLNFPSLASDIRKYQSILNCQSSSDYKRYSHQSVKDIRVTEKEINDNPKRETRKID